MPIKKKLVLRADEKEEKERKDKEKRMRKEKDVMYGKEKNMNVLN